MTPRRNRLADETSPYLLQHKDNPVDWWAWGPEALAQARATGKPILLSVGYAACHWCHVMAHESFEDAETAALMNELFVNIKVDREERPDIDQVYMAALHRLGEHGGWPLTMFLDSDARPFWGGTYFPPEPRYGKPSFRTVLREIARMVAEKDQAVAHNSGEIMRSLATIDAPRGVPKIGDEVLADITRRLVGAIDPVHGGLKGAPKFPQWSVFWLLWRGGVRYDHAPARNAVVTTLTRICQGGIYDHLGGGFARYSVDERWLVPHFEKMLYDNALLVDLLSEAWRVTRLPLFERRVRETIAWLAREMTTPEGGFAASLDADSEGVEGKFYVWTLADVVDVLGEADGRRFAAAYDITEGGNFEGHSIPNRLHVDGAGDEEETALAPLRAKLLARRAGRVRPGYDDKVLADWNGLMIAALAKASATFGEPGWMAMAERAFTFVEGRMTEGGRLRHSWRDGRLKAPATAADYANMIQAALRLHQATGAGRYLEAAERWTAVLDRHYWLPESGGYAFAADDTDDLIVRMRSASDDAVPNANATMIASLVALSLTTGNLAHLERAHQIPTAFSADLARSLVGHSGMLAQMFDLVGPCHVVVVGGRNDLDAAALAAVMTVRAPPGSVTQWLAPDAAPSTGPMAGKGLVHGRAAAYVCIGQQCSAPLIDAVALASALEKETRIVSRGSPSG